MLNPKVLGNNWEKLSARSNAQAAYGESFKSVLGERPNAKNIAEAIVTIQRSLITPHARFDKYLHGDKNAITAEEPRGYERVKAYGCIASHQGVIVGSNKFQVVGVMGEFFKMRGIITPADPERLKQAKVEADKHVCRVPSLGNAALTPAYFDDGSAATLDAAADIMFQYRLGRPAPKGDKEWIIKFLRTLTGEFKGKPL